MNLFSQKIVKTETPFSFFKITMQEKDTKNNFQLFTDHSVLTDHTNLVYGVDICKNRNLLASSSGDSTVKLWNLQNNNLIKTYTYPGTVYDVVFSKQGNLLALGGYGSEPPVKLIDISVLNKDNPIFNLMGHKYTINRLNFSNDCKYLISGSDDSVIIWDVGETKQLFKLNSGDKNVYGVAISSDNTLVASNSFDGKIRIWKFQNQSLLYSQKAHIVGASIEFSKNQKLVISSGYDGMVKLWSLDQHNLLLIRKFKIATKCIWTAFFSPCSRFIISMSNQNQKIKITDSETGILVKLFKSKATNTEEIIQVAISEDMDIIAYGENNGIAVWRRNDKQSIDSI